MKWELSSTNEHARVAKPNVPQIRAGRVRCNQLGSTFIEIQVIPPLHCRDVPKPKPV